MTTAQDIIAIAASQVGYIEQGGLDGRSGNITKYGAWYGLDGYAWCDMFVSWCFNEAGALPLCFGKNASTPTHAQRFINAHQWGHAPQIGALAFYNFGQGIIHHVGLVFGFGPGWHDAIEGNTSPGSTGSQSNGGGVYRRRRALSGVVGYGYPAYVDLPVPPTPPVPPTGGLPPWPGNPSGRYGGYNSVEFAGHVDSYVRAIQEAFNRTNLWPKLKVSGVFDRATLLAARGFQGAQKLPQDGIVGPKTYAALKKVAG